VTVLQAAAISRGPPQTQAVGHLPASRSTCAGLEDHGGTTSGLYRSELCTAARLHTKCVWAGVQRQQRYPSLPHAADFVAMPLHGGSQEVKP
jgi:hypothetical protein